MSSSDSISSALVTNDATALGILAVVLGFVFYTSNSNHQFWKKVLYFHSGIVNVLFFTVIAQYLQYYRW